MKKTNDKITCDSCGQLMKLDVKVTHKELRGNAYRIRRYKCDLCGISETIYAEGYRDLTAYPQRAIEDVNKMYKQQEENNICT